MNTPWFKFFAGDYLNDPDVDDLCEAAQGILVKMWCGLCVYGSLPSDVEEIARKCKVRLAPMQMHVQSLLPFFVQQRDGTYISERLERERQRSGIVSKARQKAANAKWSKRVSANASAKPDAKADATGDAQSMHSEVRVQMSESEGSKTKTVAPESGARLTLCEPDETWTAIQISTPTEAQIDQLYKLYPRKIAPFDAKKAIRKAVGRVMRGDPDHAAMPLADALDHLAQKVTRYAQCVRGSDRTFIPHPATWFNRGDFWSDEQDWAHLGTESGTKRPESEKGGKIVQRLRQQLAISQRD